MEWQQVIGFYHVARLYSFTKAANATFRTQSAHSQQLKALEKSKSYLVQAIATLLSITRTNFVAGREKGIKTKIRVKLTAKMLIIASLIMLPQKYSSA